MQDNLNGITNLDYTIELDGTEYNITAADSLNADVARRTKEALHIILSKHPMTVDSNKNLNPTKKEFDFDGHYKQGISIVPSDGGVFTGNIAVPNISNEEVNNYYAINLGSLNGIVKELKGFPTYIWNGELINVTVENEYNSFAPFRVVFYGLNGTAENDPKDLRFNNIEGYIECYFLAINMSTGWMSVGHCYKEASKDTTYTSLRVANADHSDNATFSEMSGRAICIAEQVGNVNSDSFNYSRLLKLENKVDETDTGSLIYNMITNITNNETNITNHKNDTGIHRRIVPGELDVSDSAFQTSTFNTEGAGANIGDIYIKIEK